MSRAAGDPQDFHAATAIKKMPKKMPETQTMKKTILTIFATALLAGSMIQAASAGEHHRRITRAYRAAPVVIGQPYRDPFAAYGAYPDYSYWASRAEGGAISAPAGQ